MISAVSLTFLSLDFLLIVTEFSNSALIMYNAVLFLNLRFSQISPSPEASREVQARRKGSSAESSSLKDLTTVRLLS